MSKLRMPSVSFIVARSRQSNVIGCENRLPWRLKSDLARFRELTVNHAVIMGRKTYVSIGRTLPSRLNIVLSRQSHPVSDLSGSSENREGLLFVKTPEDALLVADKYSLYHGVESIFVIGGEQIYSIFNDLVNTVYLTEVHARVNGDAYFMNDFSQVVWKKAESQKIGIDENNEFESEFITYDRIRKQFRYREHKKVSSSGVLLSSKTILASGRRHNAHELAFIKAAQPRIRYF